MLTVVTALLKGDKNLDRTKKSLESCLELDICWLVKFSEAVFDPQLLGLTSHPRIKLVLSDDMSLYEGLNQAFRYIETEFFMVLGAGDTLNLTTLKKALALLERNTAADSAFFSVFHEQLGRTLHPSPRDLITRMSCPHPGAILKTKLAQVMNGFDQRYRIASDYDLLCRYLQRYPRCLVSSETLVNFKGGGISSRSPEGPVEETLIRHRVFGAPLRVH